MSDYDSDTLRADLDSEINRLNIIRNSLARINDLPEEVLLEVFKDVRDECYNDERARLSSWLQVINICSYWRRIALECPGLWSSLCIDHRFKHDAFLVFMQRSKSASLTISSSDSVRPEGFQFLLNVLDTDSYRIRQLDLCFNKLTRTSLMEILSTISTPILESLTLRHACGQPGQSVIPEIFLPGGTPVLRHLSLYKWLLQANRPSLTSGLTSLCLGHDDLCQTSEGDLHIFEVLSGIRQLRQLELSLDIHAKAEPLRGGFVVGLPFLECFTFKGTLNLFSKLLRRLAIPSSAKVRGKVFINGNRQKCDLNEDFMIFADSLKSSWLSRSNMSIRCLEVIELAEHQTTEELQLQAWFDDVELISASAIWPEVCADLEPNLPPWNLKVTFKTRQPMHVLMPLILTNLPIQDLRDIYLDVQIRKKACRILRRLPHLRSMSLTNRSFAEFMNYITQDPVMIKYQNKAQAKTLENNIKAGVYPPLPRYFPKLERLAFWESDFGLYDYQTDGIEDEAIDMDLFIEFLRFRQEHLAPIRILQLWSCDNVIEEEVDVIKTFVEDVDWDCYENIKDDEELEGEMETFYDMGWTGWSGFFEATEDSDDSDW